MTYSEMNYNIYNTCNLFHSFLFDEYNIDGYMPNESIDKILFDHNVIIEQCALENSNDIFIIQNVSDDKNSSYKLLIDYHISDQMYIKMIKAFTIGFLSFNSNIIFNNRMKEFDVFTFTHTDTFNTVYDSYFLGCMILMPNYDTMYNLVMSNINTNNTVNIDTISNILDVDPIIIKLILSYNKLIKL